MVRPKHKTTALPRDLRSELGIKDTYGERKNRRNNGFSSRKDRRQAERAEKKTKRAPGSRNGRYQQHDDGDDDDGFGDMEGLDEGGGFDSDGGGAAAVMAKLAKQKQQKAPKPVLKKAKPAKDLESESDNDDVEMAEEEVTVAPRKVSKTVQDKLDQDDAEIAALEKKLGLKKGKKLPKAFTEDGLDELLGDADEGSADEGRKRKREADEWLRNKRRKAQGLKPESEDEEENFDMGSEDEDEDEDEFDEDDFLGDLGEDSGEEEKEEEKPTLKKKENPYVAPVVEKKDDAPQKYIPPSLRAASGSESESLTRLRRQAQGQLNKLSEANLVSILGEFEKLYRDYPRQHVTSTLISLLFGLICERSAHSDTFIVLHAGFVAAVYKVVGMDFGAELVQKIVETFDAGGDERGKFQGKELVNLISLLSQLYNFHVIGSTLMFDYVRLFLSDITEENTELLLKVIRSMYYPSIENVTYTNHPRFWSSITTGRPVSLEGHRPTHSTSGRQGRGSISFCPYEVHD